MDFPRLQLMILAAALLIAQIVFLDIRSASTWGLLSVSFICLVWHAWWIVPYTRIWPVEVAASSNGDPARCISILTANVLTPNRNAAALLDLVAEHEPDIVATLESDEWWQAQLDTLQRVMPHTIKCPQKNLYGMHVYSRLPLSEQEISYLVEDDVPSIHARVRLPSGDSVRIHVLHPAPPSPTENSESAERDAELVIVARSTADSDLPIIVTGDLNDVAWSSTTRLFRKISGLLDPRVGRGMFNTFHADYPLLRWPLDHLFHSHHFTVISIQRLASIGSDHFPLLTRLAFSSNRTPDDNGLQASSEDEARARSIAHQRNVTTADVPTPGEGDSG